MKFFELKQKKFSIGLVFVLLALCAYIFYSIVQFVINVNNSWDAIHFAYTHPELVNPVKDQYFVEIEAVRDSLVKRQTLIAPITLDDDEMGKE